LVVLLVDGKPVLGIVVEAQLARDARRRFSWPVYVARLRARLKCPCCLLVVTASDKVAEWAREPIVLGPGGKLVPLVVGLQDFEQLRQWIRRAAVVTSEDELFEEQG